MGKFHQILTATASAFGSLIMGLLFVWPSYTKDYYINNSTILSTPMTEMELSLVGSLPSLGAIVGTSSVGILIDSFGRKIGGLAVMVPNVLGWIIKLLSSTSIPIIVARFLCGISAGAFLVYGPIYISEIVDDNIRGTLASMPMLFYSVGITLSYIIGWLFSYYAVIWINLAACVLHVCLIIISIESPVYYVKRNREKDALASLATYRGLSASSKAIYDEYSRLKQQLNPDVELKTIIRDSNLKGDDKKSDETEKLNPEGSLPVKSPKTSTWRTLFMTPDSRRAFIVVGSALTLQVMMGLVAVQVYAKNLFMLAAPKLSSHICSVLLAIVMTSGFLLTTAAADRFGRRFLIISSSALVAICMVSLGFFMQTEVVPPWVSAITILVFSFCFGFGAGSVPYVLLAECFIPEVQNLASMLLVEWVWLMNFFIIGIFPFMKDFLGIYGAFYVFAFFGVVNAIVNFMILPETKGLSNAEVQQAFLRASWRR